MRLAQGHKVITIPVLMLLLISIVISVIAPTFWWSIIVFALLLLFVMQFFRDPDRHSENLDQNAVLSPADGVLFEIEEDSKRNITIFRIRMRFWDVHVNRMPLSGILVEKERKKGWYFPILPGLNQYSKSKNARQELTFKHPSGFFFKVIQISGTFAYRCVSYFSVTEDIILQGERLGMIRFGSETDLHLPSDKISVASKKGLKTKAGETILCYLKDN